MIRRELSPKPSFIKVLDICLGPGAHSSFVRQDRAPLTSRVATKLSRAWNGAKQARHGICLHQVWPRDPQAVAEHQTQETTHTGQS
jgi:hypothetical protein